MADIAAVPLSNAGAMSLIDTPVFWNPTVIMSVSCGIVMSGACIAVRPMFAPDNAFVNVSVSDAASVPVTLA